ncbi:MAG: GFA family protein [Rhodospirillales bacterium]|nr:GFA family protein [Rhodospirillales bacterium]
MKSRKLSSAPVVTGQCQCGPVQFEIEYPAFWAWHDHGRASRLAHGAVYATYVGTWRKRFRITAGARHQPFRGEGNGRHMLNIPRALFQSRTGRQPIYHIAIDEMQDWAYAGVPLVPLKGYPGVFCKRFKKKSRVQEARLSGSIGPLCA